MVLAAVVPAKAGTQGASGSFRIPACTGMTRSTTYWLTPRQPHPQNCPGNRLHDISWPNNHPFMFFVLFMVKLF